MNVKTINLQNCVPKKAIPKKKLSVPPPCSSGRSIKYSKKIPFKGEFKNYSIMTVPAYHVEIKPVHVLRAMSQQKIPKEWSWYNKGGNKIEDGSRNQESCGCCWAMSFATALGDRYAIKYNIASPKPSTAQLVSCGAPIFGINGEYGATPANNQCACGSSPYIASLWLEQGGEIGLEECWPFNIISNTGVAPECPRFKSNCCADCCDNDASKPKFTVKKNSTKYLVIFDENNVANPEATTRAIQLEIMGKGPVVATFWVPDDFQNWWNNKNPKNGFIRDDIYIPKVAPRFGVNGHTVVLTGWGEKNGVKYWEMRNTWGSPGYCRFAMSLSTPKDKWTSIDIPTFDGGNWNGGCISMEPGELSKYNWEKGKGGKPSGSGFNPDKNIDWRLIFTVAGGVTIILLIIFIISKL